MAAVCDCEQTDRWNRTHLTGVVVTSSRHTSFSCSRLTSVLDSRSHCVRRRSTINSSRRSADVFKRRSLNRSAFVDLIFFLAFIFLIAFQTCNYPVSGVVFRSIIGLYWVVITKPYAGYRIIPVSMTLVDPYHGFQGFNIFSKACVQGRATVSIKH